MSNGQPYAYYLYEEILKEQLLIAFLSKGAITITETDDMPIHDRKLLLGTLQQAEEAKKKKIEEMREAQKARIHSRKKK